ncbi:SDR family NAD(P)-dependent oxidoreductase [Novosphingobium sp. Leaf2]|uniref:SDR family NAD(P)-dependent oxidoreductase n=1 Tax=Novosphingobium sp. Leaf2 TaxID=1735670 RepID=UPI0006FF8D3B|nr:SDR family NAD(P)-dependent oxidoreductase [Novosphingobium sp. Leaf2]KQM18706.1 3-hydroxy-2-methylbutyryl-CoA dehydrogenase [Novosphingobium sp. Leaf2]
MKLDNTIAAIVTGGASGLGAATARALAGRGVKVAIFDRSLEAGEALAGEIGATFCEVDVTDEDSVVSGFARARAANGQERVLVNCAGIAPAARTVGRDRETGATRAHDMALFEKAIAINLVGTFRCISKAAAGMATTEALDADGARGVIVNTASVAAQDGQIGQAAYAASKGGVLAMTLPIARDLMSDGIRVNTILPGIFETPMMAGMPQNVQDALAAVVPFPKRLGKADEYATLALFLIEHDYMNGEAVRLDGAIRMGPK